MGQEEMDTASFALGQDIAIMALVAYFVMELERTNVSRVMGKVIEIVVNVMVRVMCVVVDVMEMESYAVKNVKEKEK